MAIMDLKWVGLIPLQKAIILQVRDEKFTFFTQNPKNWQNHDLYTFLFNTEEIMYKKIDVGVEVWDGDTGGIHPTLIPPGGVL